MRSAAVLLSLGALAWAAAGGLTGGPAPHSDQDRLQGVWAGYALLPGTELPPDLSDSPRYRISGNRVRMIEKGKKGNDAPREISFSLDPKQNPKAVDLHWVENKKTITWKGIYDLKGDELRVALSVRTGARGWERGSERPTSFDTRRPPRGSWALVLALRRAEALQAAKNAETVWSSLIDAFDGFGAVALSPDGKWVAASGAPSTAVRLWETATGKEVAVLRGHNSRVWMLDFSPDGKRLLTATATEVRTWELPRGNQLQRIPAGPVWYKDQITLSGDGNRFVSAPDREEKTTPDGKFAVAAIRVWDLARGKEVRSLEITRTTWQLLGQYAGYFITGKASDAILGTALSPDGKWVAAGTERGEVHVWEAAAGKKVRTLGRSEDVGSVPAGFSKDGKRLATSVFTPSSLRKEPLITTVLLWDVATGKVKAEIQGNVFGGRLTGDGKWLITGREEKTVRIWDVETGKQVRAFTGFREPVRDCFVSRDRRFLVTYDESGTARRWEVATGKELRAVKVRSQSDCRWGAINLKVRADGDARLLVTWAPSRLTVWDLEQGKPIRTMTRRVDW